MTGTDPTGEISELSSTLASIEAVLDPEVMRHEADNLRERAGDPGLWDDQEKAQAVTCVNAPEAPTDHGYVKNCVCHRSFSQARLALSCSAISAAHSGEAAVASPMTERRKATA